MEMVSFFFVNPKKRSKGRTCQRNCDECLKIWGGFWIFHLKDWIWTLQWKGKNLVGYLGQLFFFCCLQTGWKKTSETLAFFLWTFGSANVTLDQPVIFRVPPGRQPANALRKRRRILLNCGRFMGGDVLRFVLKNP